MRFRLGFSFQFMEKRLKSVVIAFIDKPLERFLTLLIMSKFRTVRNKKKGKRRPHLKFVITL